MATEQALGFGIVGMGNIAAHHIQAVAQTPGCHLVGVCSPSEAGRNRHKLPADTARVSDVEQLLALPGIDVVSVCTPSGDHLAAGLAAAQAGKHVVVEKPLEINVERCRKLIEACESAGVSLSCIFQNRYSDGYAQVQALLERGSLGRLVLGNAYIKWYRDQAYYDAAPWRGTLAGDGGAALINQSIHTIDLLLQAMGPARSVRGKVATLTHDIEGEDVGAAVVEFESGALATIEGSTSVFAGFPERLELHGDAGSAVLEAGKLVLVRTKDGAQAPAPQAEAQASGSSNPMAIGAELHCRQYAELAEAIRAGKAPKVDGASALRPVELVEAIYTSSRTGQEVRLGAE